MKNISEPLKRLIPDVKRAIAPTIVVTLVFFMTYFCFGAANSMIAPIAALSFVRFQSMHHYYACMIKNYLIYMVMAVLSFFAVMNLPLCILINALALFWIAHVLIDEYNPNNYFPAGMALIFFQISPVRQCSELGLRLLALLATFALVLLCMALISRNRREKHPLSAKIRQGFVLCEEMIRLSEDPSTSAERMESLHRALCETGKDCSAEIYAYNRSSLRLKGRVNWYCHFLLVFQMINYLTAHPYVPGNTEQARRLCAVFSQEVQTQIPSADYRRMRFRTRKPDIRSFRLRFALRQVITVTPCLVFAWATHLPNAYWLVISVFFMMIPFTDHTLQRIRQRVCGTLAGILICLGLFYLFQSFPARVIIMTIANFLIYGANGYGATVAYITCSALALQTLDASVSLILLQRLIYTLLGAAIALIANKWIFPIRTQKQISYLWELIVSLRGELYELVNHTTPGDSKRRYEIDQRIVKSYLLCKRLETLGDTHFQEFEREHMKFLSRFLSEYLSIYML